MTKNSKHKLLFITLLLTLLLVSSAYAVLIPDAYAAGMTTQQKGLSILSNVVGLDLTKYSVATEEVQADQQISYFGVVPQENVGFDLASGESRLKALYTFVDGKLQMIHVLETEGPPSLTKSAASDSAVEMAKDFLNNYQVYTADSFYGELKSTLDNVDASKNATRTSGNTQLEVTATTDSYTTFRWTYTFNGVVAPSKVVALGFKNGFLKYFVDNWNLYGVGGTAVNVSKQEAVAIALETAKAYNWSVKLDADTLDAKNFNESNVRWTSLIFDDSLGAGKARSEDILMVYPVWRVGVALDKWYGQLYGIEVDVWADTKEVRRVQEAWSTLPPPEGVPTANMSAAAESTSQVSAENAANVSNSQGWVASDTQPNLTMPIALPIVTIVAVGTAAVWSRKKKPRSVRTGGTVLCVLVLTVVVLAPIATVSATTRAGVVWGSESTGQNATQWWGYWRKSPTEINLQQQVAVDIASYFAANGYNGVNHQGNLGSSKSQVLGDISYYQSNYNYVAVVDFDHGVGRNDHSPAPPSEFHYMVEDNTGTKIRVPSENPPYYTTEEHPEHGIYDMDIYPLIQPGNKIAFAFISTCMSADLTYGQGELPPQWPPYPGRALGMPFAWTRRLVMDKSTPGFNIAQDISIDGYNNPDNGPQVYIGFPYGSASLEQNIPYPDGTKQYEWWVRYFFYYTLYGDISVNQALDQASLATWPGKDFGDSPLQGQGFIAHWWNMSPDMPNSTLAVYGNGRIHLKQYEPDYVSTPSVSGPTSGNVGISYEFSASSTDPYGHSIRYTFDWGDGSQNVTDLHASGETVYWSHSWGSAGVYSVTVRAQCDQGAWSSWSSPHAINIGNQPVWLTVDTWDDYTGFVNAYIYIDNNLAGVGHASIQVSPGWHNVAVEDPVWNEYYQDYEYLQYMTDGYGNGADRPVYSDTHIIAWYW